jgi:hypothetical protein
MVQMIQRMDLIWILILCGAVVERGTMDYFGSVRITRWSGLSVRCMLRRDRGIRIPMKCYVLNSGWVGDYFPHVSSLINRTALAFFIPKRLGNQKWTDWWRRLFLYVYFIYIIYLYYLIRWIYIIFLFQ